jgi:hypothetical protein
VAARRRRGRKPIPSLMVVLAATLLTERPPPRLPGKPMEDMEDPQIAQTWTCPVDRGEIIADDDGTYYCQDCATPFDPPPETG